MADIGSTLRETRIRDKIDITVVEESTKIRAKYLRALENEEWAVMPGPTYVKSFLRTYAEFLGLDAHMLVEEYRARYERPEELELQAFPQSRPLRRRVRAPGPPSRAVGVMVVALGVLAVLFILGITGGDDNGDSGGSGEAAKTTTTSRSQKGDGGSQDQAAGGGAAGKPRSAAGPVSVTVVAARPVWVCLVNARGKPVVGGRTLPGGREGPFRSRSFKVTVGNGGGDLRVNGRMRDLPETSTPQGYTITASGVHDLAPERRPTCAAGSGATGGGGAA